MQGGIEVVKVVGGMATKMERPSIYAWLLSIIVMGIFFASACLPDVGPVPLVRNFTLVLFRSMWVVRMIFIVIISTHGLVPINVGGKMVNELISWENGTWNADTLNRWFSQDEIIAIQEVKIPLLPTQDHWSWKLANSGIVSTKEVYKALNKVSIPTDFEWRWIWKLNIHNRLKLMLWRLASKVLPIKYEEGGGQAMHNDLCVFCKVHLESAEHIFFLCDIARKVWLLFFGIRMECLPFCNIKDWLKYLLDPKSELVIASLDIWQMQVKGAVILEKLWFMRNKMKFSSQRFQWEDLQHFIDYACSEHFHRLEEKADKEDRCISPKARTWIPRSMGQLKMNCDAGMTSNFMIAAYIVTNWEGKIMAAGALKLDKGNIHEGEYAAVELGMRRIISEKWENVQIESDSAMAVASISKRVGGCWNWITRSKACWKACQERNCYVLKVPREANSIAHNLVEWVKCKNLFGCLDSVISQFCNGILPEFSPS